MLKRFSVKNFKNFNDKVVLDLERTNNYEFNERAVKNKIVKTALVYGENASGKTNLGHAVFDIILHLTDKEKNLRDYRLYGNLNSSESTAFSYEFQFVTGTLRYEYRKKSAQELEFEEIWINGRSCLQYEFDTNRGYVHLEGAETLKINLTEKNISLVKYVFNNSLLQVNVENGIFNEFIKFVENMLWFSSLEKNDYQGFRVGSEKLSQGIIKREKVLAFQNFLHNFDIDYNFVVREIEGEAQLFCKYEEKEVNFFSVASRGTCSLTLFYYWLIQLEKVSLVFIDEFDAFYHCNLAWAVVCELLKLENTQSILTTHNTDIMTNDLLRPDCYLQIKSGSIKSFADSTPKELRKAHNLQKMYNSGAFNE